MAKATTIKDALKKLEETRGVNPAELEKVCCCSACAAAVVQDALQPNTPSMLL
jgi:hypothetical protein